MDAESRRLERSGAAVVRALGRSPRAEYRARVLEVDDRPVAVSTPYLTDDQAGESPARGIYDALGARLRYSERALHESLQPDDIVARVVFDMVEQLRCESQIPDELVGARENIEVAFRRWCAGQELTRTAIGLLLFTVLQMARARLIRPIHDELIEDQIEATRANISPIIGVALKGLKEHRTDQRQFAVPALSLANAIAEMVSSETELDPGDTEASIGALFIPPEWGADDPKEGDAAIGATARSADRADAASLDRVGGYHVFTREYDQELRAESLYPRDARRELRASLDDQIAAQSVSPFTLARRLQRLFLGFERDGWRSGEEHGLLDAARLGQIVANPANRTVFRQERFRPVAPAVVSFLIDNSGSMKRQRHETVTVLVDTLSRALDLAGARSEILGFTTASWNGGEALREWRRAGEPDAPGRLAETSHLIYKDADTSWKRSRLAVASMMKTHHFREGIDGEAIVWAYRRLLGRPEPRKLLVVISDGAPMEAATMNANGESFLEAHLRSVVHSIEREGEVEIGAVSIDQPVDSLFGRSVEMDLSGTLTLGEYGLLERLFRR
ncbi:MAG: cobalt chelatase [Acidimicrobiia bacterium]|nr:cobalt chelatase [Acidimicrobiia bacterium]